MGCDWYVPTVYYGMTIRIPDGENYRKFVSKAYKLQPFLHDTPFQIISLLTKFHSRMEGSDCEDIDDFAVLLIGFKPSNNLDELARVAEQLKMYVKDNIVFEGFDVLDEAQFFNGIVWDDFVTWDDLHEKDEDEDEDEDEDYSSEDELDYDDDHESEHSDNVSFESDDEKYKRD